MVWKNPRDPLERRVPVIERSVLQKKRMDPLKTISILESNHNHHYIRRTYLVICLILAERTLMIKVLILLKLITMENTIQLLRNTHPSVLKRPMELNNPI
jgi:hypothetical protein